MAEASSTPSPNPVELKAKFGNSSYEYAKVRAAAAKKLGDPEAEAWEAAAEELRATDSGH